MYADSLSSGHNTLYDSVGDSGAASVTKKVTAMRAAGATRVDAHYATVNPQTAIKRATIRSQDPSSESFGRVVANTEILRQHHDVTATWTSLAKSGTFDHLTLWDNNVAFGTPPSLIAEASGGVIRVSTTRVRGTPSRRIDNLGGG